MLEKKDHYTGRELWKDMPEWKRKKDVHLCRYFLDQFLFIFRHGVLIEVFQQIQFRIFRFLLHLLLVFVLLYQVIGGILQVLFL